MRGSLAKQNAKITSPCCKLQLQLAMFPSQLIPLANKYWSSGKGHLTPRHRLVSHPGAKARTSQLPNLVVAPPPRDLG